MNLLKRCICTALTLVMAQSIVMTSYAAAPSNMPVHTVSTSASAAKKTPTKVTLNKTSAQIVVGKTTTLKATVTPAGASTKLTWTSSNKAVATVDANGKVKAVKKGTANITVKTSNGKTATCKVTVITQNQAYINEVIKLVNAERTKKGLSKLSTNTKIANASNKRAKEISTKFSHTRPNGTSCFTVLKEYGISYTTAAENIAAGYATPKAVVDGWMNSSGHRKNILNPKLKTIGVGLYYKDGYPYWVQLFT